MARLIAAINMTLDGYCDHTHFSPDGEIHQYFTDLLKSADAILYGRKTYELMTFWQQLVKNPSGDRHMDNFALAINKIPKIVFSNSLKSLDWDTARLSKKSLEDEVAELKSNLKRDILVGSPSMIVQCMNKKLIDELRLVIHPVIAGSGLPLFIDHREKANLKLIESRTFAGGAVLLSHIAK
jgi:dihydrofolate reductase